MPSFMDRVILHLSGAGGLLFEAGDSKEGASCREDFLAAAKGIASVPMSCTQT